MKPSWLQLTLGLASVLMLLATRSAFKLNYPRVLLPIFDHISVNFTLEVVEKGCFKWTSSRLDLIQISPSYDDIDDDCSYRVMVTVINKEKRRNTAIVLAEDLATGEVLRCDVILDVIDQLGVLTTTRELYLEEAPETFELWAQDAQGNAFTTLEGIEFNWQIASHRAQDIRGGDGDSSWSQVLRFLTFSESKFHVVPRPIEKLEVAGVQGYMVLLEGINTGSARVTARLPHAEYSHVAPVDVNIMVLANLILDPSDVYILAGDTIEFKVLQLKQGKLHEIALNSQYYLEMEDERYAMISGNEARGLKIGRTFVLLRDRNVPHGVANDEGKATLPKASLTVVDAKKLTINLLPHYNWVTVEGESHEIALNLFTADDHPITLGPQYKIHSTLDESLFYPIQVTGNGSSIFGETISTGSSPVTGKFEKLTAKASLIVYNRLAISPPEVILPFDPNLRRQKLQFTATGGDGAYSWSSLDPSVVPVTQTGLAEARIDQVKVHADQSADDHAAASIKATHVKVAMSRNVRIFASAQVVFLSPIRLEVVRYNFETVLKDYVRLHVGLWAQHNGTQKPITTCENLHFELEFSSQIFTVVDSAANADEEGTQEPLAGGACRILYLRSTMVGQTNLKITYRYQDQPLTDQVTLHVFERLAIENPIENEVVLPIGSSRNVFYYNGPERMYNSEAELQRQLLYDLKGLDVTIVGSGFSKDKHILRVLCKKLGDYELKLEVFNTLGATNAVPYVAEFVTKVYCVKPRFVNLITADKVKMGCPLERRNSMMHVKSDDSDEMVIDVEVLDVHNRRLANISSLLLEWQFFAMEQQQQQQSAQQEQGEVPLTLPYVQNREVDHLDGVEVPVRDYVTLTLPRQLDVSLKVKTVVSDYRAEVLKRHSIRPESPPFGVQKQSGTALVKPTIENELNFLAVNRTLLPYDRLTLFLTSDAVERIKIVQGSGFYDIKASETGIVSAQFESTTRQLVISPRKAGEVKLEITDQCLATEPSFLYVSVVTVGKITILAPDRVEKTKVIEAIARLYDSNDQPLDIKRDRLELYELRTEVYNPTVLSVAHGSQASLAVGEVRYVVTGMELGETKFSVSSGSGKKKVSSAPATVQVFPPLLLLPRNATIVVGSTLQIYSKGGPTPDSNIVYSVHQHDVIEVESGVVSGLRVGRSKVTGRCVGTNPTTGATIVFSEDTVNVNVVPLDAIELRAPLARIQTGAVMPAYVWAVPSISPLILGTVEGVNIRWSTDHTDILDIRGVFQDIGVEYREKDAIVVRVRALAPGKATLHVTLVTPSGKQLMAKMDVTVFRLLELESPKSFRYDSILIPPKATIQLKANLDDAFYQLENESAASSGGGLVHVSRDGLVKSGDTVGRVQVIASCQEQSLTIPLEVKHVQYVMISLQPGTVKLRQVEHSIPQGFALTLKVSMHDSLGNEFSHGLEDVASLKHRLSKRGNVLLNTGTNYSVALELMRETADMLVVALRDQTGVKFAEDYLKLVVGEQSGAVVTPNQRLFSVGDVVCFASPLLSNELRWSSSDESLVNIDPKTGVARVVGSRGGSAATGEVLISHGDRRAGGIAFSIDVLEADRIEFFKSYDILNGHSYRGHLVIKNHQQHDKLVNVIALNASSCREQIERSFSGLFECQLLVKVGTVELLKHFKTYPSYDTTIGAYSCNIDLLTTIDDVTNEIKSNEYSLVLEVRLAGSSGLVDTSTLMVVPAVRIEPEAFSVEQIGKQMLTVTGLDRLLQRVEVKSSKPDVLAVKLHQKQAGMNEYQLELLSSYRDEWADSLSVAVLSPLTQQTVEVPILSPLAPRKCATQPFSSTPDLLLHYMSNIGLVISTVVVIAATVWVIVFCSPPRQRATSPPDASAGPSPFKNGPNLSSYDNRVSSGPFASPLETRSHVLHSSSPFSGSPGHSFGGSQGNLSHDFSASGTSLGSPIYGDASIVSPQKRVNRRYL